MTSYKYVTYQVPDTADVTKPFALTFINTVFFCLM